VRRRLDPDVAAANAECLHSPIEQVAVRLDWILGHEVIVAHAEHDRPR